MKYGNLSYPNRILFVSSRFMILQIYEPKVKYAQKEDENINIKHVETLGILNYSTV